MPSLPSPVIYEVNLAVDVDAVEAFDEWLLQHTREMLAIEGFVSAATSVPDAQDEFKKHRCVQFRLSSQAALDKYLSDDAPRMRAKLTSQFAEMVEVERRVLSVAEAAVAQQSACANCGAQLEGRFCSVCGQREEPRVPSMAAVVGELTNEMFGVESRLWRSVSKLFFQPGELSRVYLAGQRQKYMSPIRLYLLFSIITFAYITVASNFEGIELQPQPATEEVTGEEAVSTTDEDLEIEVVEAPPQEAQPQPNNAIAAIEQAISDESGKKFKLDSVNFDSPWFSEETNALIEARLRDSVASIRADIEAGNLSSVLAKFFEPVPTALFIFLPLVALLFKILYLGSGKYYVEHLIYILHNHAFIFVVVLLTALSGYLERALGENEGGVAAILFSVMSFLWWRGRRVVQAKRSGIMSAFKSLLWLGLFLMMLSVVVSSGFGLLIAFLWVFYVPTYLYRSMRVVYQRGPIATYVSFVLISLAYVVMLAITLVSSIAFVGLTYS